MILLAAVCTLVAGSGADTSRVLTVDAAASTASAGTER
jgi:hypothetical protein